MLGRLRGIFTGPITTTALGTPTIPTTNTAIQARERLLKMTADGTGAAELATVASGCFWGVEHIYRKHYLNKGLFDARVGYTGGNDPTDGKEPNYREVCTGRTGHAEAVELKFDPTKVSYAELIEFFYRTHDPTTVNRQGPDVGTQYRSAIFYHSPEQESIARQVTDEVQKKYFDPQGKKIITEISPAKKFWKAEEYHQEYLLKNPQGYECPTHRLWW